jgi:hypothetical protein
MALERGDDLRPYLAAHMPVAALLCNGCSPPISRRCTVRAVPPAPAINRGY